MLKSKKEGYYFVDIFKEQSCWLCEILRRWNTHYLFLFLIKYFRNTLTIPKIDTSPMDQL